jgi:hypothetical protein
MAETNRPTINAKQVVRDIKSGMTDLQLMDRYSLSPRALQALSKKLVAAGLLTETEWEARGKPPPAPNPNRTYGCPACGVRQTRDFDECPYCGIIVSKYLASGQSRPDISASSAPDDAFAQGLRPHEQPSSGRFAAFQEDASYIGEYEEEFVPEPRSMEADEWKMLAIGSGVALLSMLLFWPGWILGTFKILVHELGHAVFGWLYGYPSIPAFDMLHGGGVTLHIERSTLLLVVIYAAMAALIFVYRKNIKTVVLLIILAALHLWFSLTAAHSVLILFMGHGMELMIATLFIYRALSGRSIVHAAERPLYAIIGFFITFFDIHMAYKLLTDLSYMAEYMEGKDGDLDNDFVVIAQDYLHVDIRSVVIFFLICALLPPIISFLSFRYEQYIHSGIVSLLKRDPQAQES